MREPYQPIDCHFYDRLEELAVMRTECEIEFLGLEAGFQSAVLYGVL